MDQALIDALQAQMNRERMNHEQYEAFAAALENANWPGFAKWMHDRANEESDHYHKFRDHLIDRNVAPVLSALDAPMLLDGSNPLPFFEAAYALEQENTASICAVEEVADGLDDEQTEDWIIWAINEQTASERELVDALLELNRVDATGLLILDRQYGA